MKQDIPVKNKISQEKHIKAAVFRNDIRKTEPHKHKQYFEIIYLTQGSGAHWIDDVCYEVKPPVLFFIKEGQVHNWDLQDVPGGYVVILKKEFVERSLDPQLEMLLAKVGGIPCLRIEDTNTISQLFELLVQEGQSETEHSFRIMEGLLKVLLIKIQEVAGLELFRPSRRGDLYQSFLELLSTGIPVRNTVNYYAELLNTTPQHLNIACRNAAGTGAAEVLAGFIIKEARRLLLYTDKTVSEISFLLNFNDPSHFVKYFKRLSGSTPQNFRYTK